MSFSILGYDVTGSWSLQEYSPQKGHTVRLYTSLPASNIIDIKWTINQTRNVVTYEENVIHHVFQKEWQGLLVDGEGWVQVSCRLRYRNRNDSTEMELVATRDFLVVPEIKCEIQLEQWPTISSDTRFIDLDAYLLCSALGMGSPFDLFGPTDQELVEHNDDNQEYACGGACLDSCPRYEVIATPIKGKRVRNYGRHTVSCNVKLRGESSFLEANKDPNENCVALYRNNYLGKNAIYPPIIKTFSVFPRESELRIVVLAKKKSKRLLELQGLSKHMAAKNVTTTWKFKGVTVQDEKLKKKVVKQNSGRNSGQIKCTFPTLGTFELSTVIRVRGCDEVTRVSCRLTILHDQEDVMEYPTDPFTHTIVK